MELREKEWITCCDPDDAALAASKSTKMLFDSFDDDIAYCDVEEDDEEEEEDDDDSDDYIDLGSDDDWTTGLGEDFSAPSSLEEEDTALSSGLGEAFALSPPSSPCLATITPKSPMTFAKFIRRLSLPGFMAPEKKDASSSSALPSSSSSSSASSSTSASSSSSSAASSPLKQSGSIQTDRTPTMKARVVRNPLIHSAGEVVPSTSASRRYDEQQAALQQQQQPPTAAVVEAVQQRVGRRLSETISGIWRSVQQAFRDEMQMRREPATLTVQITSTMPTQDVQHNGFVQTIFLHPEFDMSYEHLQNLEPVHRGSRFFNQLPLHTYLGEPLPSEQTSCSICLGDYENGEELRGLYCNHFFHRQCIDSWLGIAQTCPVCKGCVD